MKELTPAQKKQRREIEQRIYELGKKDGRNEVIEAFIELLKLDDRYIVHNQGDL